MKMNGVEHDMLMPGMLTDEEMAELRAELEHGLDLERIDEMLDQLQRFGRDGVARPVDRDRHTDLREQHRPDVGFSDEEKALVYLEFGQTF